MPATKTRRGRASARSKKKPARRPAARKTTAARTRATAAVPGPLARSRDAAGRQLAGHRADVLAVGLFVLGAIFALGLWTALAGPVGSALADGTGAVLGRARVAVPVACFAFGVVLLWPHRGVEPDADDDGDDAPTEPPTVRIAIGALLLVLADVGILHLAYGRPPLSGNLDDLRGAGGALGAMVAAPLTAAIGVVGASIVLGGLALVGLLLALGLSIGMVVAAVSRASRTAATKARSAVSLAPIGEGVDLDAAPAPSGPAPFDYAAYDDYGADDLSAPEPGPGTETPVLAPVTDAAIEIPTHEDPSGQLVIELGDEPVLGYFNAAAAQNISAKKLADPVDTVTFCLSKGLCAPVGSVLCGSTAFIQKAIRARKMLGGGMRQAGILAAAGIVALETMTGRLIEDHVSAEI